jgi:hypothetical protein
MKNNTTIELKERGAGVHQDISSSPTAEEAEAGGAWQGTAGAAS